MKLSDLASEFARPIKTFKVVPGQDVAIDIPTDTFIKRLGISLRGSIKTTYASGSPVASELGPLGAICNNIRVMANGKDAVKSIHPYMARMNEMLLRGVPGPRGFTDTGAATAPTTMLAANERMSGAAFTYPSTGNQLILNESLEINFEHQAAYGIGRQATLFNTKRLASCQIIFSFAPFENLQQVGGTAPVIYSDSTLEISVYAIESPNFDEAAMMKQGSQLAYYKEAWQIVPISGYAEQLEQKLTRGGLLTGVSFLVLNGDTNTLLSDVALRKVALWADGRNPIKEFGFNDLQDDNRRRYGIDGWKTSGAHPQKGFAHLNFMQYGIAASGVPTLGFNEMALRLSTAPSTGIDAATYTKPVQVLVHTHEIVPISDR